jgi:alkylated DNA repair dioxygenase AlkB
MVDDMDRGIAGTVCHRATGADAFRLPLDCRAEYRASFLTPAECRDAWDYLDGIAELKDRSIKDPDGVERVIDTGRYMLADRELLDFEHLPAAWGGRSAWPRCLELIRRRVELVANTRFRVCRCIYYESGEVGADFHADYPAYGSVAVIASISLGDEREFVFRNKENPGDQYRLVLASGSLLIMGEGCQDRYEHALPTVEGSRGRRFNLTFRRFGWDP